VVVILGYSLNMPTVAIIGASPKPERASHQAVVGYLAAGWTVWAINPTGETIAGAPGFRGLGDIPGRPDIITMYVNPTLGATLIDQLVSARPTQLWLNPGADGEPLASLARARGLDVVEACTLVALRYGNPLEVAQRMRRPPTA
jgi:hypothetical protein